MNICMVILIIAEIEMLEVWSSKTGDGLTGFLDVSC